MSCLATFCNVLVAAVFDGHAASSCVISMCLNNVPVTTSLASDLVLALDWFHFVQDSASDVIVHLTCGPLDLRRPLHPTIGSEFVPSSSMGPASATGAPVFRGNIGVEPSSSPSVFTGGSAAVSPPSSTPYTRGVDVVAASTLAAPRTPHTEMRGVQTSLR
ncbi:hypothetical protein MVEN_02378600 [Mycena venus]|uniref:Secreted protein n=1 Tax=Mycena venus TaxID=2733690 RepID=A0A8H7CE29_9AGAR|nr:hypothetical protein MVEN_02378600 [Mycena venus]